MKPQLFRIVYKYKAPGYDTMTIPRWDSTRVTATTPAEARALFEDLKIEGLMEIENISNVMPCVK